MKSLVDVQRSIVSYLITALAPISVSWIIEDASIPDSDVLKMNTVNVFFDDIRHFTDLPVPVLQSMSVQLDIMFNSGITATDVVDKVQRLLRVGYIPYKSFTEDPNGVVVSGEFIKWDATDYRYDRVPPAGTTPYTHWNLQFDINFINA